MQENLFLLAEQVLAYLFILWGLSFIVQTKLWVKLVKFLYSRDEQTFNLICLVNGLLWLPFGLFFVLTHNHWDMNSSIIVTVMGWLIVIKCSLLLLYPKIAFKAKVIYGKEGSFLKKYIKVCGILYTLIGLLVLSQSK